ncbi:bifunctional folylpolyglutamate synthase/dihydrofolate synthase [Paracoccus aurantiacus]|uniref:Dihydrofolate synthase/folylpolyglutamate synthase n=1 Tax=Paracoccus aurantiacus TaxID=2599412 RepID=A0A5C6S3D6_9RHOB|nr:folylpolyglutamate synthase/dihydrofolate synthase family protein [Paracoccus aurantiacus]TXB68470.1 bifunctional folylpolyglutamate synthase/dihydrofolate synthase [Paracoccus aurantiacus]
MDHSDAILKRVMGLHPKMIDLSLDRMFRLLDDLGNPQDSLPPVVHIAGTNGKGSTVSMIRAGLESAGKRVHVYTSPHLARFHERIRLAGNLIPEDALSNILTEIETVNAGRPITFFELTTAAGFLAFARHPADYTLLEVGLGGRLDATNVVADPALTVITPVSIDHTQYLGETLAEIAAEKAGILKRGAPAVIARQHEAALSVIEDRAARLGVPVMACGQQWHSAPEGDGMVFQDENGLIDMPRPNLRGPHQIDNAGTAIASLRALGFGAPEALAAVTRAEWPARMQRLSCGPLVDIAARHGCELWLDGGHNPAGGQAIAATLAELPRKPTHLVCGMLNTKDIAGYLRPLSGQAQSLLAVSIPGEANTLPAETTRDVAASVGFDAGIADDVASAVAELSAAYPGARLLICGSLYLAGTVLRENG